MRSHRDCAKAILAYDNSLDGYDLVASIDGAPKSAETNLQAMSLHQLSEAYHEEKKRGAQWAPKTEQEKLEHIALLVEILGNKTDILSISAMDAKKTKDTLFTYPKNRHKNPLTRGKSLTDAISITGPDKISLKTVNKYLQTYSDMFEWARRNSYVDRNLYKGLTLRESSIQKTDRRDAFSDEQIRLIIGRVTNDESGFIKRDYQKWGPLIGVYTGARLNEISQLFLSDIIRHEGIWCFDLNDDDEQKQLKAAASKRKVPIHSALLDYGIIDYVDQLRQSGYSKLFPNFTYCVKNGWGRQLGRWFNDTLLPNLNMKSRTLVFHSLRHTMVTKLYRSEVQDEIVKAIVGHAPQGVTQQSYFKKGYRIAQLRDAIERISFNE
jgi:integrase